MLCKYCKNAQIKRTNDERKILLSAKCIINNKNIMYGILNNKEESCEINNQEENCKSTKK